MSPRRAAVFALAAALCVASVAGAEEPALERPIQPNRPMLITGLGVFGVTYVTGVVFAAKSGLEEDNRLYIPLAGPWLDFAQRPCNFGSACTTSDNVASSFLVVSGVLQSAGIIVALTSLAVPERPSSGRIWKVAREPEVRVVPLSLAGGGGLGAVGTF
jgi:hypothetical protein